MARPIREGDVLLDPPYLIVKPGFTEEDFYQWADEDSHWEYLDGRIVMHSPASRRHEDIFGFVFLMLRGFVSARQLGTVLGSRFPMRLDPRWSPEPDVMVVLSANAARIQQERLEGPADLVVEVCSESDPTLEYREKLPRYRTGRVGEIWIVDRFRREVYAEVPGEPARALATGRLHSSVVPGFWIDVDWLWQDPPPAELACLEQVLTTR